MNVTFWPSQYLVHSCNVGVLIPTQILVAKTNSSLFKEQLEDGERRKQS